MSALNNDMNHLGNVRFRRSRVNGAVAALVLLTGSQFWACSDDLDFTQKENTPCEDCTTCETFAGSCLCDTCISWASDPETKTLLFCEQGIWRKQAACPGGAAVGCTDRGAHWTQCLDESGNDVEL